MIGYSAPWLGWLFLALAVADVVFIVAVLSGWTERKK